MNQATASQAPPSVVPRAGLDDLMGSLRQDGYQLIGPTVQGNAICVAPIDCLVDLPRGLGDSQDNGQYRVLERDDGAYFAFANPAGGWKKYLFPPRSVLFRSRVDGDSVTVEDVADEIPKRAFFGIRGCDLAAIGVQDAVFMADRTTDPAYAARREGLFIVAANCSDPSASCFCPSMGTGPAVRSGADLVITELDPADPDSHRFLIDAHTERGQSVLAQLGAGPATPEDIAAADRVNTSANERIERHMDTEGLPQLLRDSANHPQWKDVAKRCLSCGNCTMSCPTCFCSDIDDVPNAAEGVNERVRVWSSCFQLSHSYIHGGSIRLSPKSRYRQWMTHKLSTWWDQFDMSGCVGCGRCITWCPVGIDITAEVRAIRDDPADPVEERA
ncbi:MAG: 4Fe-4S dicluster domain-containing protein [Candidatus Nanopelagicales bacterium]|nr:4Fe-4S dicluster domain-containing protein [Candidatus Nanopelagicales bacterium]